MGCVGDWRGGGKGDSKGSCNSVSSLDLSQTLRLPNPTSYGHHHLTDHDRSGFSVSKTGHIVSPSFSQTCFSSSTSHLSTSQSSQNKNNILDSFLFIHFHIYHLTYLTNFRFEIFFVLTHFSFFSKLLP